MVSNPRLTGKVCLVTGATRGIGKGIALQLGQCGATVYITGRTLKKGPGDLGSLEDTAKEIEDRGGHCIPVQCDHSKDDDVQRLFDRIKSEQNGQLDVLVNNAYSAVNFLIKQFKVPFWEQPLNSWDEINNVGLRNHYICSMHAARLMVPCKSGLIINISSMGGMSYVLNVAYGIGKEAMDRMAADGAVELRKHNVAFVSLWPAAVDTELVREGFKRIENLELKKMWETGSGPETIEYAGRAVAFLAADSNIMKKTGRILMTTDLGSEYGFVDVNGRTPTNIRSISVMLESQGSRLSSFFPSWIKVPCWILALYASKF